MRVSYNRLWKLLIDRKMKKVELRDKAGISSSTLALMGKDRQVGMNVLNCNIGEIVDVLPEDSTDSNHDNQRI